MADKVVEGVAGGEDEFAPEPEDVESFEDLEEDEEEDEEGYF